MQDIWSWMKSRSGPVVTAIALFILTWAATRLLDWGVEDQTIRDVGMVILTVIAVLGFCAILIWSPWLRLGGRPTSDQGADSPAPKAAQSPLSPQVAAYREQNEQFRTELDSHLSEINRMMEEHGFGPNPYAATDRNNRLVVIPDRASLNQVTGDLVTELASVSTAWAVWYTGMHAANEEVWQRTGKPQKVVLLDPDLDYITGFAPSFNRSAGDLAPAIRVTSRAALKGNAELYWFNGPMISMVIGEPDSEDGWVRVELAIPFSAIRPNVIVKRGEHPVLFDALKESFLNMLGDARCRRMITIPEYSSA